MKVSIGGDSRFYMFGALGLMKAIEKLGFEGVEYTCCGFACISASLALVYSTNRSFHILESKDGAFKKIFGSVYEEGMKPPNAVEITLTLASSKVRLPILHRNRFEELIRSIVPNVDVPENLDVLVLDLEEGRITNPGFGDLRRALEATNRYTPTSDPLEGRYVSCARTVGVPEGDIVLRSIVNSTIPEPRNALEYLSFSVHVRRSEIEKMRCEKANVCIEIVFSGKETPFRIMDTVYKKALRVLSEGIYQET